MEKWMSVKCIILQLVDNEWCNEFVGLVISGLK